MRMITRAALVSGAAVAVGLLAACSDSPVSPASRAAFIPKSSFQVTVPAVTLGQITVCKDGNVGGSFDVTRAEVGGAHSGASVSGLDTQIDTGDCVVVAVDPSTVDGVGSDVTITEDAAANVTSQITGCRFRAAGGSEGDCTNFNANPRFINSFHGYVITVTNTLTPPENTCDFSTFGGFVLLPNNISYGGNAGRVDGGFAYGDLNFVNHTNGDHIHVWNVTDYGHPDTGPLSGDEDSRLAFGMGTINGAGSFPVEFRFLDSGEPAKKLGDKVYLNVNGVVLIPEQTVNGGNIQLHPKCKKAPKAEKH